jgi:hypothetical protein
MIVVPLKVYFDERGWAMIGIGLARLEAARQP